MQDQRFSTPESRAQHTDELYSLLAEFVATKTTEQWLVLLKQADIPSGPVNSLNDLLDNEHLAAQGFFQHFHHPELGVMVIPKSPVSLSRTPTTVRRLAPRLGQHSEQVKQNGWSDNVGSGDT